MNHCIGKTTGHSKQEILRMGVIEYAEQVLKLKLTPWQKTNIEGFQKNPLTVDQVFQRSGILYGPRACYLVYERWKNRISSLSRMEEE
jgi:hypothetical protein